MLVFLRKERNQKMAGNPYRDRFIPRRRLDMREIQYRLNDSDVSVVVPNSLESILDEKLGFAGMDYAKQLDRVLGVGMVGKGSLKTFTPGDFYRSTLARTFDMGKRYSVDPQLILDAPGMMDDFYLNLLDWSSTNLLAVGLKDCVYLWNSETHDISLLMQISDMETNHYISSLRFLKEYGNGFLLAIGTSNGALQVWDVFAQKKIYQRVDGQLGTPNNRISSISILNQILSHGTRSGRICNYDVRSPDRSCINEFLGHTQEVCGLDWSTRGHLSSGGNDNMVRVWDVRSKHAIFRLEHRSAIKAIGWCPFRSNVLATGGGTGDRSVRIWNADNGTCVEHVDTESQICSLKWSVLTRELVTAHGYAKNELVIWAYPYLLPTLRIPAHQNRILHLALSADGTTLVSTASDENLKFWKLFEKPKNMLYTVLKDDVLTFPM